MVEPTTFLSFHDLTYHPPVSLRDGRRVDRRKIDLRGFQVLVAQALADYREVAAHVPHGARPCVAGHVCGKRDTHAGHFAYLFQVAVHLVLHPLVLHALRAVLPRNDGQQVRAAYGEVRVFVDDGLHGRLPAHGDGLARLRAAVAQLAVPHVGLLKVGHVYERHALQVEAKHEHIAREGERRASGQAQCAYGAYRACRHGALGGLGKAREHVAEDGPVGRKPAFHGLAVERAQGAQVARRGVAPNPAPPHPRLVLAHRLGVERVDGHVLAATERGEAGQGRAVGLGRAVPAYERFLSGHGPYEAEEGLAGRQQPESLGHVVGRVVGLRQLPLGHDGPEPPHVAPQLRGQEPQLRLPRRRPHIAYGRRLPTPLRWRDAIAGLHCPCHAAVYYLEIQRAFPAFHCGRPELQSD